MECLHSKYIRQLLTIQQPYRINNYIVSQHMSYYSSYLVSLYGVPYDAVLEAELVASRVRESRMVQEELQMQNRLRRSRIQEEIVANRVATQHFLVRSRVERDLALECAQKERQVSNEMALTESILNRSRRSALLEASQRDLQNSREESQRMARTAVIMNQDESQSSPTKSQIQNPTSNKRRRVVQEDVSRILTTY